jgi:NitT/TauT family transport system substrate-binding protein
MSLHASPLQRGDFIKLASCASLGGVLSATGSATAQDLRTVHILAVPTDGVKSTLYAQKAGLFRKHGIQTDVVAMGSGSAIFSALVGGSADIGSGSLFPVFAAYSRGIPLRIIAPASLYTSDHADALLVVQKDSPIKTGHDMNGKTLGTDAIKDTYSTATRAWVDQHGGDGSTVRELELKPTEQVAALDAGRIDSVVLKSPFLQAAMATGKFRVIGKPLDAIGSRFLLSCWVASVDFISKNPEIVSSYVAALTEASRYTNAHQSATTDMVAQFTGQDPQVLASGIRSVTAETLVLSDVQKPLDFAVKYGIIAKGFDSSGLLASSVPGYRSPH